MKCKRCKYFWLPMGVREIPRNGNTYAVDMGICTKCDSVTSRIHTWTPGDLLESEMWIEQRGIKLVRIEEPEGEG